MWLSIKGGRSFWADDIYEVYLNPDCTWLEISRNPGRSIIITTSDISSSDITGYPIVVNVDTTDDVWEAFEVLNKHFDLSNCTELVKDDGIVDDKY